MKNITKKIIIYSMVGMMQVGLGTAVLEASPRSDWQQQQNVDDSRRKTNGMSRR